MIRQTQILNGEWDFCPLSAPEPVEVLPDVIAWESKKLRVPSSWRWSFDLEAEFQPYDLYGYPAAWNYATAGLVHRTFTVHPQPGASTWLVFNAVLQRSAYFINGKRVETAPGSFVADEPYLPIELDVTEYVQKGENDLVVWCGSFERISTPMGEKVLFPSGSWFAGLARGPWQDVLLETRPEVSLGDIAIRTSVRKGMIEVEVGVESRSLELFSGQVAARVLDGDTAVWEFVPLKVTLQPGEQKTVNFEAAWNLTPTSPPAPLLKERGGGEGMEKTTGFDAELWSPENPKLYTLETVLLAGDDPTSPHPHPQPLPIFEKQNGEGRKTGGGGEREENVTGFSGAVDSKNTRFGFREVWLEGPNFVLNGVRVNLRGDAWHYQGFVQQSKEYALNWYRMCRQTGINFVRLHAMPYPPCYLEAADEFGMLIVDESAIYGSGKAIPADHPRFLANCHAHLRALVRRDRNHSSVIIWSMQNEMRWVDGRDGYRDAIPALTATIKFHDSSPLHEMERGQGVRSRPVMYDGDNRLVPAGWCDIVSMHYNIDGTVAAWDKTKPLIFGEHGPFHYVSPQTCSQFGGPAAYLSFEACMESIGLRERLFIEYARKEGVTGQTPFNTVNYAMWAIPDHASQGIPVYSLTVNNGSADAPLFRPSPSWAHLAAGFKPVTVIPNEYDTAFYGGTELERSFSLYNDTLQDAQARMVWRLTALRGERHECRDTQGGGVLDEGEVQYAHQAGERFEWGHMFNLPPVDDKTELVLAVEVYHQGTCVHQGEFCYQVYPASLRDEPIFGGDNVTDDVINNGLKPIVPDVVYLGSGGTDFKAIKRFLPSVRKLENLDTLQSQDARVLIIGADYRGNSEAIRTRLEVFVRGGGFLLVLEQSQFTLGELSLSGRGFPLAFINDPQRCCSSAQHPIFKGLTDADLRFWHPDNVSAPGVPGLVANGFHKPVNGDFKILLECGDGDFGWGGLLWTPLLEYTVGRGRASQGGRVVFNQVEVSTNWEKVPPACVLLRNLLEYACRCTNNGLKPIVTPIPQPGREMVVLGPAADALYHDVLKGEGADAVAIGANPIPPAPLSKGGIIISPLPKRSQRVSVVGDLLALVDADALDDDILPGLIELVRSGGDIVVLPAEPRHQEMLSRLAGVPVTIQDAPVYQVGLHGTDAESPARGVSIHDLYHLERVTYTPGNYHNTIVARYALDIPGAEPLFESVHNPWEDYFVRGRDAEWQKIAVATMNQQAPFEPRTYGAVLRVGKGRIIFSQLNPPRPHPQPLPIFEKQNGEGRKIGGGEGVEDKVIRVYSRLLANLGAALHSPLFEAVKGQQDLGIETFMALAREPYQDESAMLAYFTAPDYTLNNLGEGVYGWMKRAEKAHGAITIPGSNGRTYFLTVFVESELNRDPSQRDTNVLPDPSIVPDLCIEINCPFQVYVNGQRYAAPDSATEGVVKIEDVLLKQGLNRLVMVCQGGGEDIRLNAWFLNKFGDPLSAAHGGLKYHLMLD